jgi:hypothetical protein
MSEEEQQIAILKAMGWTEDEPWLDGRRCFVRADSNAGWDFNDLPDYLNDLNAMHEAEKWLIEDDQHAYGCYCIDLQEEYGNTVHLTAVQRAEAFLKTIGQWNEDDGEVDPRGFEERSMM